ncbi:unnamed protein product [Hyaloperonospora brassicae]|uniref:Uncharacterized protein n=1 Tax=Hyaloperonospora brassicae TaxID=162125 RepID=A0AAV0SVI1_HYABA|nr:unnamed protein product [Hyaloperonospora brassicae]
MTTQSAPANWRNVPPPVPRATPSDLTSRSSASASRRSKSQPKRAHPTPQSTPPPVSKASAAPQSAYARGVARARTFTATATAAQLETRLQQLLQRRQFHDAAFLIAASAHLRARFETADVARLMLDSASSAVALEQAAQLVRDLKLQQNEALVTLLINELVRAQQFSAAVRLAGEMVPQFEQLQAMQEQTSAGAGAAAGAASVEQPRWTPVALIQAMVRARKYRAALKYAKQFGLLELFPAPQLVAGMLDMRCWDEAISSIIEMQLVTEFPMAPLAVEMLQHRQWSLAVKCVNRLSDATAATKAEFYEALVRAAAQVGDFVTSLRYLRELKLDEGTTDATRQLLQFLVDTMLAHGEFYKAIKYAIKFKLAKNPLEDAAAALAAANGEEPVLNDQDHTEYLPQYDVEALIRRAIEGGQFHVATTFIKRLRLREAFADELVLIDKAQQTRLLEFRQYAELRLAQYHDTAVQQNLQALLGGQAEDEMVELEPVEKEVVLFETEEVFLRKDKAQVEAENEDESGLNEKGRQAHINTVGENEQQEFDAHAETVSQSRFGFARETLPTPPAVPSTSVRVDDEKIQLCSKPPPPSRSAPPPGLFDVSESNDAVDHERDDTGSFNFAEFAKSVQASCPPLPPDAAPLPPSFHRLPAPQEQQHRQHPHADQQKHGQAIFGQHMLCMPNAQSMNGPPGYPMPPTMPPLDPTYFPRGQVAPGAMQSRGYAQPPPPPLPPSGSGGGAFDVAALAMQFHNKGSSHGSPGFRGFGGPSPPPVAPAGILPMGQPQQFPAGMPPLPFSLPQPQSTFKPSMSYVSVTTTRQKK